MEENVTKEENTENKLSENNKKMDKKEVLRALKFLFFSASAGVLQILSFTVLSELVFLEAENSYGWSYFIALTLSVLWNFTLNKNFTFKSATNVPVAMLKVFVFYLVFTPISIFGGNALTAGGMNEYLVLAITMVLNFVLEYLYCELFVYKNQKDTLKTKDKKES